MGGYFGTRSCEQSQAGYAERRQNEWYQITLAHPAFTGTAQDCDWGNSRSDNLAEYAFGGPVWTHCA